MRSDRYYSELLHASALDSIPEKREQKRQEIQSATERFLAAGGKIYRAGWGETADRSAAELNRAAYARRMANKNGN